MSEEPLHQFIDMEAYDVVGGDLHRRVKVQLGIAAVALGRIADSRDAVLAGDVMADVAREALLKMRELE